MRERSAARLFSSLTLVGVNREGLAFSAASGIYAGGGTPLILIQNTGLMESGDSMRGWTIQMEVPVVLMVGYRGWTRHGRQKLAPGCTRSE